MSLTIHFIFTRLQLRKAVVDHVSDSFLETNVPLLLLIEAARSGNAKEVEEYANVFREHANKLVEVSAVRVESASLISSRGWGKFILQEWATLARSVAKNLDEGHGILKNILEHRLCFGLKYLYRQVQTNKQTNKTKGEKTASTIFIG